MKNEKSENIKKALAEIIPLDGGDSEIALEKILQTLDKKKVLRYHRDNEISLLSTAGRVLTAIIEDPKMTIRAISVYLDLSETMIDKTVKQLISHGLISKTKMNRQNIYVVNVGAVLDQPDIKHVTDILNLLQGVSEAVSEVKKETSDVAEQEPW
jgi:predicted transcriptional regulator